jgi:hypothetical protein
VGVGEIDHGSCSEGEKLNEQETRGDGETPIDNSVCGVFGVLALKELTPGLRDVRGLLNVRKQMATEEIREVRVTWVDSKPDPSATNT